MSDDFQIRPARPDDHPEWIRLRTALFPDSAESEASRYQHNEVWVAETAGGSLGGFIEVGWRNYAEKCATTPVAYIEAWYVEPQLRRRGIGKALVQAAEDWARSRNFREIASDTELGNDLSVAAHQALGYEETERLVCFRKELESDGES